jgi:putative DNA primase/helicase
LRWRTLLLSSGEKSLAQIMAGAPGGVSPVAGQEVRLAHIPVDSDTGVFDGLTDGDARRALVRQINDAAAACYGHAGRAFLEQLTGPDGLGDATEATAEVKKIAAKLVGSSSTNEIDRVAIRFALVGFAGELATQYGITGWPSGRALAAAFALFSLWRKHWGSASRDETNFLQRLDEWLCEHRSGFFAELDPVENKLRDDRQVIRRSFFGYARLNESGGTWLYYLNRAGWRNLTQPAGRDVAVNALKRVGRLEAGAQGDGGKLMRVGGEHGRFYVIHGEGG